MDTIFLVLNPENEMQGCLFFTLDFSVQVFCWLHFGCSFLGCPTPS